MEWKPFAVAVFAVVAGLIVYELFSSSINSVLPPSA